MLRAQPGEFFSSELISISDDSIREQILLFIKKKSHKIYSLYSTKENDNQLIDKLHQWLQKNPLVWATCHSLEELNLVLKYIIPYFLKKKQCDYMDQQSGLFGQYKQESTISNNGLPQNLYSLYSAIVTGLCFDHLWQIDAWKKSQDKFLLSAHAIKSLCKPMLSQLKSMAAEIYFSQKIEGRFESISYTIQNAGIEQNQPKEINIAACDKNANFIINFLSSPPLRAFFATEYLYQKLSVDDGFWTPFSEKMLDAKYDVIWQMLAGMLHSLSSKGNTTHTDMIKKLLVTLWENLPERDGKYSLLLSVWKESGASLDVLDENLLGYFRQEDLHPLATLSSNNNHTAQQFSHNKVELVSTAFRKNQ